VSLWLKRHDIPYESDFIYVFISLGRPTYGRWAFFRGRACHSWAGIFKDITDAHTQAAAFYFSLAGRLLYVVLCSASGRISRRIRIREKRSSVFETLIVIILYWLEREKAFLYEG